MSAPRLIGWDQAPDRRVAVAVELWDPVTLLPVWRGLEPRLTGREDKPVVNVSGRFVWMGNPELWPAAISVDTAGLPFERIADKDLTAGRPANWPDVEPQERLIRVRLTPTPAYVFAGAISCVRGDLYEKDPADPQKRLPIPDAKVALEWWDARSGDWQGAGTSPVATGKHGEFVTFVRVARRIDTLPDVAGGWLRVRLVVTRGAERKTTPQGFQFLALPAPAERVAEAGAREQWVSLDWKSLRLQA